MGKEIIAQFIALRFRANIRKVLAPEECQAVNLLNEKEENPSVCHTHDFVDSNIYMSMAFQECTGKTVDIQNEHHKRLWATAWAISNKLKF